MSTMKQYEISVWHDVHKTKTFFENNDNTKHSIVYLDEELKAVIGSNVLEGAEYAHEPKWVSNTNGSHTLSFYMFYKYYDAQTGSLKENPYIKLLANEQKIKLKLENKWYDLIIKKVDESSDKKSCTYTCKDLFINELSKNGYNLEFSNELENNQGTAIELADRVLDKTDWRIDKNNSKVPIQYIEEPLYRARVNRTITGTIMSPNSSKNGNKITIKGLSSAAVGTEQYIYIFYSSLKNKEKRLQFIYDGNYNNSNSYPIDDDNIILTEDNLYIEVEEYTNDNIPLPKLADSVNSFIDNIELSTEYRGKRIVRSPKTTYDNNVQKAVNIYKTNSSNNEIYGFIESEAVTTETMKNLIVNSKDFTSTNGWKIAQNTGHKHGSVGSVKNGWSTSLNRGYLTWENTNNRSILLNTGFVANKKYIHDLHKDEEYVFEFLIDKNSAWGRNGIYSNVQVRIKEYTIGDPEKNGHDGYIPVSGKSIFVFGTTNSEETNYFKEANLNQQSSDLKLSSNDKIQSYDLLQDDEQKYTVIRCIAKCNKTLSYTEILEKNIGIFIYTAEGFNIANIPIYGVNFYKKNTITKTIDDITYNNYIIPPGVTPSAKIRNIYKFYNPNTAPNNTAKSVDDIHFLYSGDKISEINKYILQYDETYSQIHGINIKESNRFNIIQDICESFNVWARFNIYHEQDGKIQQDLRMVPTKDEYPIPGKKYYIKNTGNVSNSGYLINMTGKGILSGYGNNYIEGEYYQRTTRNGIYDIKSYCELRIIPKKYVVFKEYIGKEQYAGFKYGINLKTIQRSVDSEAIVSKIIVKDNTNKHSKNGFCSIARSPRNILKENIGYDFRYYINQGLLNRNTIYNQLYGSNGLYTKISNINQDKNTLIEESTNQIILITKLEADVQTYRAAHSAANDNYLEALVDFKAANNGEAYNENKDYSANTYLMINYGSKIIIYKNQIIAYAQRLKTAETDLRRIKEEHEEVVEILDQKRKQVESLLQSFFDRYSRFIQEGTWTDQNYKDDDLYYYEAMNILATSAMPKISYTFKAIDISNLPGYEGYKIEIGDKTYVEDTEFFGYKDDGITPYHEEVIISEITEYLRQAEKTEIKIQNYKTQFEDLFQRIAAATQTLQFHEGEYAKASSVFTPEGTISERVLQNTMNSANWILSHAKDQSVVWDKEGITISSFTDTENKLRIVNRGIVISNDGGDTWQTAISGKGINATYISTGTLDADKIRIMNGQDVAFSWDKRGLNAYDNADTDTDDTGKGYVRFNKFGIFGVEGNEEPDFKTVGDVIDGSKFSLTWKGIQINVKKGNEYEPVFKVQQASDKSYYLFIKGNIEADSGKIGGWEIKKMGASALKNPDANKDIVGLKYDWNHYLIPIIVGGHNPESDDAAIRWGSFRVYPDGHLYATSAYIKGDIEATSLKLGSSTFKTVNQLRDQLNIPNLDNINFATTDDVIAELGITVTDDNFVILGHKVGNYSKFFKINTDGLLEAENAIVHGKVYAGGGEIGGWSIGAYQIRSDGAPIYDSVNKIKTTHSFVLSSPDDPNTSPEAYWIRAVIKKEKTTSSTTSTDWDVPFCVTKQGILKAKGAQIEGEITATSGKIGGWTIGTSWLGYWGSDKHFVLAGPTDNNNYWIRAGNTSTNRFAVSKNGYLTATGVTISGTITATSGRIGGWNIGDETGSLSKTNGNKVFAINPKSMDATGAVLYFRDGTNYLFSVNSSGKLTAKNADIAGKITATEGTIGGWTISSSYLGVSKTGVGSFYIAGPNDISDKWIRAHNSGGSETFAVSKTGVLSATGANISGTITATSGAIGGWTLKNDGSNNWWSDSRYTDITPSKLRILDYNAIGNISYLEGTCHTNDYKYQNKSYFATTTYRFTPRGVYYKTTLHGQRWQTGTQGGGYWITDGEYKYVKEFVPIEKILGKI